MSIIKQKFIFLFACTLFCISLHGQDTYPNGQLKFKGKFKNDTVPNGKHTHWYENGQIKLMGAYKNGLENFENPNIPSVYKQIHILMVEYLNFPLGLIFLVKLFLHE